MKEQTVSKRIFVSNAWMIGVTLALILLVNIGIVRLYWESVEQNWQISMEEMADSASIEDLLEEWTIHQKSFYILLMVDALVCIAILILVSSYFTGKLARHITSPLKELENGAKRIQNHVLTEPVTYQGDTEFEEICTTFNEMQEHILQEQEKNAKYEKARTEMIAGISHDLRTPLTAIRGTIKALLDGVVTQQEQQEKFLKTAYRRTEDMNVLLEQLFYVSKLETGNMPMHPQKMNLNLFLKKYIEEKRELLAEENINISGTLEEISDSIELDGEQLQRVLDNLLENSRKYAQVEDLKIAIDLKQTERAYNICFSDNGIGVPEESLKVIFEEFYRGDASRNQKEGNGLGLYIVKCLVDAMGGKVTGRNENGFVIDIEIPKGE